jgi:aspartate 1-decarboxylase
VTRSVLRAKLHGLIATQVDPHYEGSITLDAELLRAADIAVYEKVLVVNVTNGERFETYAIAGPAGSGTVGLNGAAARLGLPGDVLIVMAFGQVEPSELAVLRPVLVLVDAGNRVREVRALPAP